mgnify:CR=1 FL=1
MGGIAAGADDVDSDIDPVTSSTPVVVTSGSSSTVDGGLVGGATLGGQAWTDRDGDGVHESGEPVRSGVVVRVTGTDGTGAAVTRETTTDADGNWSVGVPPGTYTVTFVAPDGTEFVPAKGRDRDADDRLRRRPGDGWGRPDHRHRRRRGRIDRRRRLVAGHGVGPGVG